LVVNAIQNSPGVLQSLEQRTRATLFLRREQVMAARHRPRAFAEALETEYFPANRADELFAGSVSGAPE